MGRSLIAQSNALRSRPNGSDSGCEPFTRRTSTTTVAAHIRIELADLGVKPYALGMIGRAYRDGSTSTVTGGGLGLSLPVGFAKDGVSMEIRYRDDGPSSRSHDHWEFLLGVGIW